MFRDSIHSLLLIRFRVSLLAVFALVNISACDRATQAERILINGHIVTMDERVPEVEALAMGEGQILAVGTNADMVKKYPDAEKVDLAGKTVMPGFIEAHGHLLNLGKSSLELNLVGVETPDKVVNRVGEQVAETSPGEWIVGWGWDEGAWAKNYPTNDGLNQVSPKNPVFLRGLHGYAGWANAKALEIAGITRETPNPPNGEILKDPKTDRPTGILMNKAQDLLTRHIATLTLAQREKAFMLAAEECLRHGITTVHDAGVSSEMFAALRSLSKKKLLKIRVYAMIDCRERQLLESFLQNGPEIDPDHWLNIRSIKCFTDGALGSRGAALLEPYSDAPNTRGLITIPEDSLYRLSVRALRTGFQVATHAIGDKANRITLNAYARALKERKRLLKQK